MKDFKRILIPLYIFLLLFIFFSVKSVLRDGNIEIEEQPEQEEAIQQRIINVNLEVITPVTRTLYTEELRNTDTVMSLLETARDSNPEFKFEKEAYSYGQRISQVNGISPSEGEEWKVYTTTGDISALLNETYLVKHQTYTIKLSPKTD